MDAETLLENFEILAEAPAGIDRLRELILSLAVHGRLLIEGKRKLDVTNELPSGWMFQRLDDVCCYIQRGKGPKYTVSSKCAVVSQKCVQWTGFDISKARFVDEQSLNTYGEERFLRNGDILWNSTGTGTVGRTALYSVSPYYEKVVADSHVTVLRAPGMNSQFLWCWTASPEIQSKISDLTSGTTNQQELNLGSIKSLMVPVPPLEEQNRIVAKVDELMALCDQLEQSQKQRDHIRTAARKSAIDAISTSTTPEELETAWKRINNNWDAIADTLESVGSLRELVLRLGTRIGFGVDLQKSPKHKLNEVSHVSWGNLSLTKTSYVEDGQFLAVSAAGPDGRIGHAEHDKLTPVISAIGARCGTMFMPGENFTAIKNTMTVTPDEKKINNWYLFYALKGSQLPRRGTAQPFLSKTDIENFEITVPSSLEDQRVIVAKVDELMALCDQLESELKSRSEVADKFARSVVSAT